MLHHFPANTPLLSTFIHIISITLLQSHVITTEYEGVIQVSTFDYNVIQSVSQIHNPKILVSITQRCQSIGDLFYVV